MARAPSPATIGAMTIASTPSLAHVHVADAMHHGVLTCAPATPLPEVARIMAERSVHCVVVAEPGAASPEAWAVVSDRDLVIAAGDGLTEQRTAGEIAGTEAPRIATDAPLAHAVRRMAEHDVSHLVVVGAATGLPEGVLSTLDIAAVIAQREA
jgi:CBS domain-containing protein